VEVKLGKLCNYTGIRKIPYSFGTYGFIQPEGLIYYNKPKNKKGLILMFVSAGLAMQFELILGYLFLDCLLLLLILKKHLKKTHLSIWFSVIILTAFTLATFILAELKYHFQSVNAFKSLLLNGYSVMSLGENRFTLYIKSLLLLFNHNVLTIQPDWIFVTLAIAIFIYLLTRSKNETAVMLVLVWIFSSAFLLLFGGYNAYYVNIGIGLGIIITTSLAVITLFRRHVVLAVIFLLIVIISDLSLITKYNKDGLILEIKAQPHMLLSIEHELIDTMYTDANGRKFTVKATSMPYQVQTVWAYLFNQYALAKWGYLPFWQDEPVAGYPGTLPRPVNGTTCVRYLIREPIRGIPQNLIDKDIKEENIFSNVTDTKKFGDFTLEERYAKGDCND
jgi:hypothetical protein